MTFSERLQTYRKTVGLSQEELAGQLGVSRQSVSKWEQGQAFPETETLIQLSDLMGLSLDSLLREGDAAPAQQTAAPGTSRLWRWAAILLAVAAVALAFAVVKLLTQAPEAPEEPQTYPLETPAPPEEPEPELEPELPVQKVILTEDLWLLREWFFDFGRQYRLDYMPTFSREDGPPEDATEYLYWVYSINLRNWGDNVGTMTRSYVEQTVQSYFGPEPGIVPGMHRTLRKSWGYDEQTETYTAWPESLRDLPYYRLDSITFEAETETYTIRATEYNIPMGYPSPEQDAAFRQALLDGNPGEMTPRSTVTVSFYLSSFYFDQPRFLSFQQEWA